LLGHEFIILLSNIDTWAPLTNSALCNSVHPILGLIGQVLRFIRHGGTMVRNWRIKITNRDNLASMNSQSTR
jgi:hypothetical protein